MNKKTFNRNLLLSLFMLFTLKSSAMDPQKKPEVPLLKKIYNSTLLTGAALKHFAFTHPLVAIPVYSVELAALWLLVRAPYDNIAKIGTNEWKQSIHPLARIIAGLTSTGLLIYSLHREEVPCALVDSVMANRIDNVRWYLEHGAHPNITDKKQRSLLYFATEQNHKEIAGLLLEHGADPNKKEYRGAAPIHRAIEFGHLEIADLLKKYKADLDLIRDDFGLASIHVAAQEEKHLPALRWLIRNGADMNKNRSCSHQDALYIALKNNNMPAFKLLLQSGALINHPDILNLTSLATYDQNKIAAGLLFSYGADVNAQNGYSGLTTLMIHPNSAESENPEFMQLLLSLNADKTIKDREGKTVMDRINTRKPEIQALLCSNQPQPIPEFARKIMLERASDDTNIVKKLQARSLGLK